MQTKRKLITVATEIASVKEVEVGADAIVYSVEPYGQNGMVIAMGVPEGSAPVKRKIWMIATGGEISVEAQNGEFVGTAIVEAAVEPGAAGAQRVLYAVFLEKQEQAITRGQHRGPWRAP